MSFLVPISGRLRAGALTIRSMPLMAILHGKALPNTIAISTPLISCQLPTFIRSIRQSPTSARDL